MTIIVFLTLPLSISSFIQAIIPTPLPQPQPQPQPQSPQAPRLSPSSPLNQPSPAQPRSMSSSSSSTGDSYPPVGKTAIVTGGSSGIGRSAAVALAKAGWNVVVTGRRVEQLQESVDLIDQAAERKGAGKFVQGELTKEEVVQDTFSQTLKEYGRVDLIFCNAGISPPNVPFAEQKLSDWKATVDINLTAPFLCAREAFRVMSKQSPKGGRIIINGSISAHTPRPMSAPYTATKHAMTGLTKSLSLDGREHDIAVSQIDIGNAASDMTTFMREGPGPKQ
ncbi:NAD(P)-binding protein, partial [Violaceomyces palustris]